MIGLGKKIKDLFAYLPAKAASSAIDVSLFDDLCDILVQGDIKASTAFALCEKLHTMAKQKILLSNEDVIQELKNSLTGLLKTQKFQFDATKTNAILVLGVNGVGKTTTIAKLANLFSKTYGKQKVFLAAADTFRAAAVEQLQVHGANLQVKVIANKDTKDPGAVIFDALSFCKSHSNETGGIVLCDSAGRLHNKENLVNELKKIDKICQAKADVCKKLLVLDATTGQNAFVQAQTFAKNIQIDGVVITKCDSSAKGGVCYSISSELKLPICYIGTGEGMQDIKEFSPQSFSCDFLAGI